MSTELAVITSDDHLALRDQMEYAKAVSVAAMLPDNYRGKPADIMLAVGLGQSMGLSPAESLYRISVIKGKPTASAELIAANVRKAGHRLRVSGDETTCTATIVRVDDPDYEFAVTRDLEWAQRMGLADQANYRKQPGTMLQWRAITAVARLACPEALYGVAYTSDEIGDLPGAAASHEAPTSRLADLTGETVTVEQVIEPEAPTTPPESPLINVQSKLAKAMYAAIKGAGIPEAQRVQFLSTAVGRELSSSKELTEAEVHEILDNFDALLQAFMVEPPEES